MLKRLCTERSQPKCEQPSSAESASWRLPLLPPQPLKSTGGSANHTHSVLFCPVERRFPYIRIQTRQVRPPALCSRLFLVSHVRSLHSPASSQGLLSLILV